MYRKRRTVDRVLEEGQRARVLFKHGKPQLGGRRLQLGGQEWIDFETPSYLGLDADPLIVQACVAALHDQGLNRYSTRTLLSSDLYLPLEQLLARITGFEDAIVFPNATLLHQSVLPLLGGGAASACR